MTSHWFSIGLAVVALGQSGSSAIVQNGVPVAPPPAARVQPPRPPQSPTYLASQVDKLGSEFNGRVGIAVRAVDEGWSTSWKGSGLAPQQRVSKMWVGITALDEIVSGALLARTVPAAP